ncbi:hypothetical protein KR018_003230 [Drosophila ironensis]|nr:hypothetical protein KR018_003230 [Drosophila ironensis]
MQVVDLHLDRSLICDFFDGYKLSFEPTPVLRQANEGKPLRLEPGPDQFSLLHAELFGRHNLLWSDPWMRKASYYINTRHQLVQCIYNEITGQASGQRTVFVLDVFDHGDGYAHKPGDYNYSVFFVSERFMVICDGINTVHLVDTGDRSRPTTDLWQAVTRTPVDSTTDHRGHILYDARMDTVQERKQISLVVGHIGRRDWGPAISRSTVYYTELTWGRWTLTPGSQEWGYEICQKLVSSGSLMYCAFEPRAESLVVASNRDVMTPEKWEETAAAAANPQPERQSAGKTETPPNYSWSQAEDTISIRIPMSNDTTRGDYVIRTTADSVHVEHMGKLLISGTLFSLVDHDLTIWAFQDNKLLMSLTKAENVRWPRLLHDADEDAPGESDEEAAEQPESNSHMPIPNLEDPIEECDLGLIVEDSKIVRFNLSAQKITHSIFLGSTAFLFNTQLRPGFPPAFATRQGVDASLWLQSYQPSRPDNWGVRHEGQLHAFGYIMASKQLRKFVACCPNFEYVAILETCRHVLIYRTRYDSAEGLRKRNGPPVALGKQCLVTLDDINGEILGVTTAPHLMTILTETGLLHLQL